MGKLRFFAAEETVAAAERVMNRVIEIYDTPELELQTRPGRGLQFVRSSRVLRTMPRLVA